MLLRINVSSKNQRSETCLLLRGATKFLFVLTTFYFLIFVKFSTRDVHTVLLRINVSSKNQRSETCLLLRGAIKFLFVVTTFIYRYW